jgi:hypothetical protein
MTEREIPEGYRLEWVPEGDDWKVGGEGHTCRMKGCRKPAAAALLRRHERGGVVSAGERFQWFFYCEDHLYGRKIEDGVVKHKRLVEDEASA